MALFVFEDSTRFDKGFDKNLICCSFNREHKKGGILVCMLFEETCGEEQPSVSYALLAGEDGYGVRVSNGKEIVEIHDIAPSREQVSQLLDLLVRGSVTPVTARDIVEDWLLR